MQRSVTPLVKPHNFMHPDDNLILEDESGRVKLAGSALSPAIYVTGIANGFLLFLLYDFFLLYNVANLRDFDQAFLS